MSGENVAPLAVAAVVVGILVIAQPLSGNMSGISLNWIGAAIVAVGGVLGFME